MPATGTAPPESAAPRSPRIALLVCLGLLAILVAGGLALHVTATTAYRRSFERTETLQQRSEAAAFARTLEPWDSRFGARAVVMHKWLRGSVLLSQGADLPAMLELQAAYRLDVGDQELLALFKKAQEQLTVHSNFKAHIQHAHEGPGGTLRPQDLMR
jgi:protein involved in polysaccharide export with SLBB domain